MRYYWLKLKRDFFTDKRIKKLRKIAGGDTYTIIYLKMQLLSLQDEGVMYFDGVENTFEEEIALQIDEDVEDVKVTVGYLLCNNLLKKLDDVSYELTETKKCIGQEGSSAERVRKYRENKKKLALEEEKMLQCNNNVQNGNGEKEIEKEIEIDKDIDINNCQIINNWDDNFLCECVTKKGYGCNRRSTYNINGKNYCNQHSKKILGYVFLKKETYFSNEKVNEIFLEFLDLRKKIKAVNSDRAVNTLINKLNKYDDDTKYRMIEQSIVNSWKDVYELKKEKKQKESFSELLDRMKDEV